MRNLKHHVFKRVQLWVCLFVLSFTALNGAAARRDFEMNQFLDLGNVQSTTSFTVTTNSTTDYLAVQMNFTSKGKLKITQTYATVKSTSDNHLLNQTWIETGKYSGDYVIDYSEWEIAEDKLSQTFLYEIDDIEKNPVLYLTSNYGLSSSGSIASTLNLNGVTIEWYPEGTEVGGDDKEDPWPDYVKLETDKYYDNLQTTPVYLKFTPPAGGVMTVTQYGSPMLYHLVTDPAQFELEECTSRVPCEYLPSSDYKYFTLTYRFNAGTTYYFNSEYGIEVNNSVVKDTKMTQVLFTWSGDTKITEIPENAPEPTQIVENKIYSFTPSITGFLTVRSSKQIIQSDILGYNLLFREQYCTTPINCLSTQTGSGEYKYTYKYEVQANRTYYVRANLYQTLDGAPFEVFFETSDQFDVSLKRVEPQPGYLFDDFSYVSGVMVDFDPSTAVFSGARFTYTPIGESEPVTVPVQFSKEASSTAYYINIWDYYMNAEYGTDTYLTIRNINYNNIPLTRIPLLYTNDEAVTLDNGTIVIRYPRPDVKFEAQEVEWPTLYSYYAPGTEAGIVDITFTENIQEVEKATLIFGTHSYGAESGDNSDPTLNIPFSIKDNVLTLDFTGIDFDSYDVTGYTTATLMIFGIKSVDGQSYPGGASPYETVMDFNDMPYSDEIAPDYMEEDAFIVSPAEKENPTTLNEIVIGWGREIDLVQKNATVEVQIVTEVSHQAPLSINEDGNLVVDVSNWSTSEGAPVMGEYKINIPGGIVKNSDGEVNKAQSLSYVWKDTSTGIDGISVHEAAPVIYNLQGIRIMKDSVRDLPEGIYIVNGKKLVIN